MNKIAILKMKQSTSQQKTQLKLKKQKRPRKQKKQKMNISRWLKNFKKLLKMQSEALLLQAWTKTQYRSNACINRQSTQTILYLCQLNVLSQSDFRDLIRCHRHKKWKATCSTSKLRRLKVLSMSLRAVSEDSMLITARKLVIWPRSI